MWSKQILKFQEENKKFIDLKIELHLSYYNYKLLSDYYKFSIKNDKLIIHDIKSKKDISDNTFFYWYSFIRFEELSMEERKILYNFNEIKNKVLPTIKKIKIPEIKDTDDNDTKKNKIDKIKSNNDKIKKLEDHVKSEAEKRNQEINNLRNFRLMYPSTDSLERLLKNIKIILENE